MSVGVTKDYKLKASVSVTGQVDVDRRESLSPDTMTLLVFLYESLTLGRKIITSRIVRGELEHYYIRDDIVDTELQH
jgi:hypothetical protein